MTNKQQPNCQCLAKCVYGIPVLFVMVWTCIEWKYDIPGMWIEIFVNSKNVYVITWMWPDEFACDTYTPHRHTHAHIDYTYRQYCHICDICVQTMCVKHTKTIYHLNGIEIKCCAMIITFRKVYWNSTEQISWDLSPKKKLKFKPNQINPTQPKSNQTKQNESINKPTNQPPTKLFVLFFTYIYCVCRRAWNPLETHKMWSVYEDVDDWYDHQLHWSIQPVHVNVFVARRVSQNRLQRKRNFIKQHKTISPSIEILSKQENKHGRALYKRNKNQEEENKS